MEKTTPVQDISRFNIVFEKLEEAKSGQDENFNVELKQSTEANSAILLLKEYQDCLQLSSFTFLTKS